MGIKRIRVENFKSFKELDIELGPLNVMIGANASGKSNFVEIFRFLHDIVTQGLDNAISLQGDVEYLRNTGITKATRLRVEVVWNNDNADEANLIADIQASEPLTDLSANAGGHNPKWVVLRTKIEELSYKFALSFVNRSYRVVEDELAINMRSLEIIEGRQVHKITHTESRPGSIVISNVNGRIAARLKTSADSPMKHLSFPGLAMLERQTFPKKTLLLERVSPFLDLGYSTINELFTNISIYDFDPKLPKKAVPITGTKDLAEDGNNLAIVLRSLLEDKGQKRMFTNLVKDLLPFIQDVDIVKHGDRSLLLQMQESYGSKVFLPASLMSDGTINLTALLIALYFEGRSLTIIEEPERNIHPYLISKVMNMVREVSQNKQIIITTHNPEVVKHTDLNSLLLVSRGKDGFSTITRPGLKEEVQGFLHNEIGIDELYVHNLLGA